MKPYIAVTILLIAAALLRSNSVQSQSPDSAAIHFLQEKHLKNVRQLTFGAENAEAYWSFNNKFLSFQHTDKPNGLMCDQIF